MIKNIVFDIGKVLVRFDWEDYLASFQFLGKEIDYTVEPAESTKKAPA